MRGRTKQEAVRALSSFVKQSLLSVKQQQFEQVGEAVSKSHRLQFAKESTPLPPEPIVETPEAAAKRIRDVIEVVRF